MWSVSHYLMIQITGAVRVNLLTMFLPGLEHFPAPDTRFPRGAVKVFYSVSRIDEISSRSYRSDNVYTDALFTDIWELHKMIQGACQFVIQYHLYW